MKKPSILTVLQAAAGLPYGELRVLIALIAKPDLTIDQLADEIGVSSRYLGNLIPVMCHNRLVTRMVRVIGYDKVEDIYIPRTSIDFNALARKYVANGLRTDATNSCTNELTSDDSGCEINPTPKEV